MLKSNHKVLWRLLFIVLPLFLTLPIHGLDPKRSLSEFSNQLWLTESGLPQNTVQAITQTGDGYLWIGTQEGLARFTGTAFVVFDKENTPQFKSNDIRALLEDRTGTLWVGTSYGLLRFQGGSFTCFTTAEGLPDNGVAALAETPEGTIWIATTSGLVAIRTILLRRCRSVVKISRPCLQIEAALCG